MPLLDRLARRGLLTRHPDQADRRRRLLRLTAEGTRFADRLTERADAVNDHFLRRLDPAARAGFVEDLRRLLATDAAWGPSPAAVGRRSGDDDGGDGDSGSVPDAVGAHRLPARS